MNNTTVFGRYIERYVAFNADTIEESHRAALAEDAKRNFCADFHKKAMALPAPDLNSPFAKEVGAFLDKLSHK